MKGSICALAVLGVMSCGGDDAPAGDGAGGTGTGGSEAGASSGGSSGLGGSGGDAGGGPESSGGGGAGSALPTAFTLTVSVNGEGRVTSTPAGIECGSTCEATFPPGTQVVLDVKEEGGVLSGWSGACSGSSACSLSLDADVDVAAIFEPLEVGPNAHGIAVTPDGTRALVTLGDEAGKLQVISLSDGSIVDSIDVGSFPGAVAVAPDGSRAVVNNRNTVSIVTLSTRAVQGVPSPCAGDTLYDIALTTDGARAVTTMFNGSCVTNTLTVITLDDGAIENQYPITGSLAAGVAVVGDGSSVLVSRGIVGTQIDRVALSGGQVTNITDTSSSFGIALTPNGAEALIASGDGDTIKRLSLATNAVTGSIDYASNQDPHNIAISPDGALAVVAGSFDVGVLSLASGEVLWTFSGGGRSVAITPDGQRALVTRGSTVRVYSLPPISAEAP